MVRKAIQAILMVTVVVCALFSGNVLASDAAVNLSGSAEATSPGDVMTVSFNVANTGDSSAYGVALNVSSLPQGWSIKSQSAEGGIWKENSSTWLWLAIDADAQKQPTLSIQIPENATPGSYTLNADLTKSSNVIGSTSIEATVTSPLTVSGENISVASSGRNVTLNYSISNTGDSPSAGPALRIGDIPANWSIISQHADSGVWKASDKTWVWLSVGANASVQSSISLKIPDNAENGTYSVDAMLVKKGKSIDRATSKVTLGPSQIDSYDANNNGKLELAELQIAIQDWASNEMSIAELQSIISRWATE